MKKQVKFGTPHNEAQKNEIAKIVLMPGDPKRAKYVAEKFLKNIKLVNDVRQMSAYTGFYQGRKITIMASGMGIPSMGIYSSELFEFYDVDYIIRIGTTGAYDSKIALFDLIVGERVISESSYFQAVMGYQKQEIEASELLIRHVQKAWKSLNLKTKCYFGKISSSDAFYRQPAQKIAYQNRLLAHHALSSEMESTSLYTNALRFKKHALTILTVSDNNITNRHASSTEREKQVDEMALLALTTAIGLP